MNTVSEEAERRRRVVTRAVPLTVLAVASFLVGASAGSPSPELRVAERFLEAWEQGKMSTMHAQLSPRAAAEYPADEFASLYEEAERTATLTALSADEPEEAGDGVVTATVQATTNAFTELTETIELPMTDERVDWEPHLVFAGLASGESLQRRTRAPQRAAILADDGTPLARGPAVARSSPLGEAAASVAGTVGPAKRRERGELEALGFPPGTLVGANGLELAFDRQLAGTPGGQLLAVAEGGSPRVLAETEPERAPPLRTTINAAIQESAVAALSGLFGGIAVLDAGNGSVRALAGLAFSSPQPPGSTFKIVTTVAALEAGAVELDEEFPVETAAIVEGREISNAGDAACGGTFTESFAESCNSVFAPLGVEVGEERLIETAERFGWNAPPALYEEEAAERVQPPPSTIPEPIGSELDIAVSALGQGRVLATPLQMASVAQTIANGGTRSPTPLTSDPELAPDAEPVEVTDRSVANSVRDLMIENVTSGTGLAGAIPEAQVAGKTGTAELGPDEDAAVPGEEVPQEENAWFVAFAPARQPQLAVAVMIVDATGSGGDVAAPIAAEILSAAL